MRERESPHFWFLDSLVLLCLETQKGMWLVGQDYRAALGFPFGIAPFQCPASCVSWRRGWWTLLMAEIGEMGLIDLIDDCDDSNYPCAIGPMSALFMDHLSYFRIAENQVEGWGEVQLAVLGI